MISRNQLKMIRTLQTKKHRQKYQKFAVEGEKIVREALQECAERIELILVSNPHFRKQDFPIPPSVIWEETDDIGMKSVSSLQTPPGILAVIRMPEPPGTERTQVPWMLYLDGIRDPGNLGTIIRSADWFGFTTILFGPGCVDWSNPKVIQASMGSVFRITFMEVDLEMVTKCWPDHPLYAGDIAGEDPRKINWPEKGILMLGGESHGLTSLVSSLPVCRLCIKRNPGSRAESLNVATAAGILISMISGSTR